MKIIVNDVLKIFEAHVPQHLAEDWDNVGLQIGTKQRELTGILTTLDVTKEAIDYAILNNYNLIFSHHPMIFKGIKTINTDSYTGSMIAKLIKHDITVYSAHTNLDIVSGGLNDMAANRLGLQNIKGLVKTSSNEFVQIVVFVPQSHVDDVRKAMGDNGAGSIGEYSYCSFSAVGEGRFKPEDGANPYIGQKGNIETVEEIRIEAIAPKHMSNQIVKEIINAHPYEEVAYNVYPLVEPKENYYIGRIGELPNEMTTETFAKYVRKAFPNGNVRFAGANKSKIKRVALCTGSGASFIKMAQRQGADAYITGDLKYHECQQAKELGILVVDAGHFGTEEIVAEGLVNLLNCICSDDILNNIKIDAYNEQKDFFLDL